MHHKNEAGSHVLLQAQNAVQTSKEQAEGCNVYSV